MIYELVLTAPRLIDGVEQPAGTVINRIVWDGISPYDPGEGVELRPVAAQDAE